MDYRSTCHRGPWRCSKGRSNRYHLRKWFWRSRMRLWGPLLLVQTSLWTVWSLGQRESPCQWDL